VPELYHLESDRESARLSGLGNTTREEEGLTYIVGSIKNDCDTKFGHVTVIFKLDREPGPTESLPQAIAYAYSSDVEPGETRQFKTALPISKNSAHHFDGINAY
jgi:hypothetical protein